MAIFDSAGFDALTVRIDEMGTYRPCPVRRNYQAESSQLSQRRGLIDHSRGDTERVSSQVMIVDVDQPLVAPARVFDASNDLLHVK